MQDLLESMFGTTGGMVARYVIAFLVVLLLLLALRWFVKRFMGTATPGPTRGRQPRLAVMDVAVVDARRRLVLVRRDNVEHLVMIGGPTDIVVEQTIVRGMPLGTMGRLAPRGQPEAAAAEPEPAAATPATAPPQRPVQPPAQPPRAGLDESAHPPLRPAAPRPPEPLARPPAAEPVRPSPPPSPSARPPEPVRTVPVRPTVPPPAPPPPAAVTPRPPARPLEPPRRPAPSFPPAPSGATLGSAVGLGASGLAKPAPAEEAARAPVVAPPEPALRAPGAPAAQPVAPPKPEPVAGDFDDLARRLDEALRIDLDEEPAPPLRQEPVLDRRPDPAPYIRPTRGPAAKAEDDGEKAEAATAPPPPLVAPAEPPADRAVGAGALGAAAAWLRPRAAPDAKSEPPPVFTPVADEKGELSPPLVVTDALVEREPEPPTLEAVADLVPDVEPVAAEKPVRPAMEDLSAQLADDLARLLEAEPLEASDSPEPARAGDTLEAVAPPLLREAAAVSVRTASVVDSEAIESEAKDETGDETGGEDVADDDAATEAPEVTVTAAPAIAAAPEVAPAPKPTEPPKKAEPDLASLEDEMARLLDELAGDGRRG